MNKKLLALLLAILMVAMSAVAMADTQTTLAGITKIYTTDTELPDEELSFTATAVSAVKADGTSVTQNIGAPTFTGSIETRNMTEDETGNYTAAVSISSSATWPFAGTYTYSLSEIAGKIQGVTYAGNSIAFKVLVGYKEVDGNLSQDLELQDIQLVAVNGVKEGSFTNAYNSGSVKVTKTVSGNAASTTDTFKVNVTFAVPSDSDNVFSENVLIGGITGQIISADKKTITGTIEVKHGDVITLSNIPVGTIVTVAENDTKVNTASSNDPTKYTASYEGNNVAVSDTVSTIAITNTRTSSIETGVTTDSMPYILLMAFVAILAVAFVAKKRSVKE